MAWQIPADNNIETTNWEYDNPQDPNDGNTGTYAFWFHAGGLTWSDWIEFYMATPILCNKIRYLVGSDGFEGDIEIQGYWNEQWNNIYTGSYVNLNLTEKPVSSGPRTIQNFRVRMRDNGESNSSSSIYEFQADATATARSLIGGCLAGDRKGLV
jgi:hypothetical protein